MSVLLFTKYDTKGASSRVRFYQFLPLDKSNILVSPLFSNKQLTFKYRFGFYPPSLLLRYCYRLFLLAFLGRKDSVLIIVEKELFPGLPLFLEAWVYRKFESILDYDDGVHLASSKFSKLALLAKRITVGSYSLMEYYLSYNPNVKYYPSTMKRSTRFTNNQHYNRVLWIGSPSTSSQLDLIISMVVRWCEIHNWRLRVVGYHGLNIDMLSKHKLVELLDWTFENEDLYFKNVDVGLMPLESTDWNNYKCSYKIIQYMAHDIPIIASAVGENVRVVNNGKNGFLVDQISGFEDTLTFFKENNLKQLRRDAKMIYDSELSFDIARKIFMKNICVE